MNIYEERLAKLKQRMKKKGVAAYYIPTADFHDSEYVSDYFKVREFFSGFTGSAGSLVVTEDESGLWTDGRYFIQAADQLEGSGIKLYRMGEEGVPSIEQYIASKVPSGGTVCIDHGLFLTVAENLIGNAARFAEKAISIQITLQNDSLVLKVEDDGAGYPLSLVQNGPNPFETTSSNSSHFGMGLYSSRILCEKHGGRLILGNQAGGGASATAIFHFV